MYASSIPPWYETLKDLQADGLLLGSNNNGIHLVRDKSTGKSFIKKTLRNIDVYDGFAKREIDTLYQLRGHPNITNLERYELHAPNSDKWGSATIWIEFCSEGSVSDLISRMKEAEIYATEGLCWHVLRGLAEAIHFCQHGRPGCGGVWNTVFHNDIQPSNVLFAHSDTHDVPRVLLSDFGCADKLFEMMTSATMEEFGLANRQDVRFAPPEAPEISFLSDIYQIGIVLYCMMFSLLEPGDNFLELPENVMREQRYSYKLRYVVARCLDINPGKRPLVEELLQLVGPGVQGCGVGWADLYRSAEPKPVKPLDAGSCSPRGKRPKPCDGFAFVAPDAPSKKFRTLKIRKVSN